MQINLNSKDLKTPLKKKPIKLSLFDKHVEKQNDNRTTKGKVKGIFYIFVIQNIFEFLVFLQSYKEVIKSKIYFCTVVGRILDVMAFKGYMVFLPKYLENHFGIPQYRVHLYMGNICIIYYSLIL